MRHAPSLHSIMSSFLPHNDACDAEMQARVIGKNNKITWVWQWTCLQLQRFPHSANGQYTPMSGYHTGNRTLLMSLSSYWWATHTSGCKRVEDKLHNVFWEGGSLTNIYLSVTRVSNFQKRGFSYTLNITILLRHPFIRQPLPTLFTCRYMNGVGKGRRTKMLTA